MPQLRGADAITNYDAYFDASMDLARTNAMSSIQPTVGLHCLAQVQLS